MEVLISADLILKNAAIVSTNGNKVRQSCVAIKDGRIIGLGGINVWEDHVGRSTKVVDCQGMVLMPGFHDAHCHFMALASSLQSLDCRSSNVDSISDIKDMVKTEASLIPAGQWIRGFGYDDQSLIDRIHPSRDDLDEVAPDHPVRLDHRSGHAMVLNSLAMKILSISKHTPDPLGGIICRDHTNGEPTGLFLEMTPAIQQLMLPNRDQAKMLLGVAKANELLLSKGITSIQDAGHTNDIGKWKTFRELKLSGRVKPRIIMMVGSAYTDEFVQQGLVTGSGDDNLRVGSAKVMLTLTTGHLYPSYDEIKSKALRLHRQGFQIAFHAVEEQVIEAVTDVLLELRKLEPTIPSRHRIEHCSEATKSILSKIYECGAVVVTHPGFVYHYGDKYRSTVDEVKLDYLYPLASLDRGGVSLAVGSDAPVSLPDPILDLYAGVTRKTKMGDVIGPDEGVSTKRVLEMLTKGGAYSVSDEGQAGDIKTGYIADLVLLNCDPLDLHCEELRTIKVIMTVVAGEIVWQS